MTYTPSQPGYFNKNMSEFLPLITEIVNLTLQLGIIPNKLRHALIKPLLKKPGLDLIKKNYLPVSNLILLCKIIKGAVIKQFTEHLSAEMTPNNLPMGIIP